jgi:hypothetical protein
LPAIPPYLYVIAVVAIVMMWRGIWNLLDLYLLPKNPKLSNWISLLLGLALIALVLILAPL